MELESNFQAATRYPGLQGRQTCSLHDEDKGPMRLLF